MDLELEINKIKMKLDDLKRRWPAHSVKPEMVEELDRLEDELSELMKARLKGTNDTEAD